MGFKYFSSGDTITPPNPNPKNFEILDTRRVNGYYILVIRYHGCTNYEGNKILVFDGPPPEGEIDPHFLNGSNLLARFVPTIEGLRQATRFCSMPKYNDRK